jgi:hypothetical protein
VLVWQASGGELAAAASRRTGAVAVLDPQTEATLEAYADTIIPGQKRYAGDVAVAGAAPGPSAAAAGVLTVFQMPETGIAAVLPGVAQLLNGHALGYAGAAGIVLDPSLPPFVALPFEHRTALAQSVLIPGQPDHPLFVLMATLTSWAFDTAGARHTIGALAAGHAGLAWIRFPKPKNDGLWHYARFSYGRALASTHRTTTRSGSPA